MNTALIITTLVTISLALLGYFATYFNNLRLSQRSERLSRVNRQLSELYGPLFALSYASHSAWIAFRLKYRSNQKFFFSDDNSPTDEELKAWRLWMTTVFMPINQRMYELVLSKSDLLIETTMPEPLLELCAHVAAYFPVLKKWEANDFTEHTSPLNFPDSLGPYCDQSFQNLKAEQSKLLGNHLVET